jgi:hypothetical protein
MMPDLESLKRSILSECDEDHVGLWSVIRDFEEFVLNKDPATIRDQTLRLLHELLAVHEIKAGFPTEAGKFRSLRLRPEKVMARIEAEWPADHRPTIGEGLWFTRARKTGPTLESYVAKYGREEGTKMYRRLQREAGLASAHARQKKRLRSRGH